MSSLDSDDSLELHDSEVSSSLLRAHFLPIPLLVSKKIGACSPSTTLKSSWLRMIKDTTMVFLALFGLCSLLYYLKSSIDTPLNCDCGKSVEEAISRGCEFDGLASKSCNRQITEHGFLSSSAFFRCLEFT